MVTGALGAQYFQELSPDVRKMQNARRARRAGPASGGKDSGLGRREHP